MYADYEYYVQSYRGDILTADNAAKWLDRASDYIDGRTLGRLQTDFPVDDYSIGRVKKAVCAVAEEMYQQDLLLQASSAVAKTDGSVSPPVKSITSGKESVSYGADGYAQAASGAMNRINDSIIGAYLAGAIDGNGISLTYMGREGRYVR